MTDRRDRASHLAVLALLLAGCSGGGSGDGGADDFAARISEARLRQTVDELTALGPRGAGTAGELAARDYVVSALVDAGVGVSTPSFDYVLWQPVSLEMSLDGPEAGPVPGGSLTFSTGTPNTGIRAPMVYLGKGQQSDYAQHSRAELAGRIHLVDTSEDANRALQYLNAQVAGAAAFVEMTSRVGEHGEALVELGAVQPFATIPAVAVDQATGARLRRNLTSHLTITSASTTTAAASANVVGVLRGASDDFVTVSAHLDSLPTTVGAVDDGSGIASVIELARLFAAGPPLERSVHFVLFSAEEQNLQGSFQYVLRQHAEEIRGHCKLMVEIDVAGLPGGEAVIAAEPPEVGEQALAYMDAIDFAGNTGSPASISDGLDPGSDVLWYIALGIPTLYVSKSPNLYYHTPYDTLDKLDFHSLRYEVAVDAHAIAEAASGAEPAARLRVP